ncbi:MAG: radical SAM protein [Lachnospiraceae bacterium]|nr:radical SAM protein [Lachnospiraceae bacterium]
MMYSRVYVEITTICNRNCTFCPGTKREPRRMSMDEFMRITEKLKGVTEYLYLHVMGEPLTHPLLPEFIRYASGQGFRVAITTNGTLLSKRGQELLESGVYKVNISIHSFEEGSDDAYHQYISDCLRFADAASRADILTVLRLWNRGFDEGRNINTLALLREYFSEEEWSEGSRGSRIRSKLHLEYGERFEWPDMEKEDRGNEVFCYGLKDHFAVLCDGRVIPCCLDREGEITLGNLFTQPPEEILSSSRAVCMKQGFQKRQATEELCRKCGYARRF